MAVYPRGNKISMYWLEARPTTDDDLTWVSQSATGCHAQAVLVPARPSSASSHDPKYKLPAPLAFQRSQFKQSSATDQRSQQGQSCKINNAHSKDSCKSMHAKLLKPDAMRALGLCNRSHATQLQKQCHYTMVLSNGLCVLSPSWTVKQSLQVCGHATADHMSTVGHRCPRACS